MSFVKSNPVRPTSAQLVADSDEDALSSSIESVTAPNNNNNNNLDVSLNSRNLLLEFDSGSESLQTKNPLAKFTNLLDIQETESTSTPTTNMTITDATILAIREATELNKNNNKRQRRITTNTALTIDSNGEDENGGNSNNNNDNDDSIIQKQSIVGLHTAKELMSKVYDTYIELELPGNILYIYQIHPNREKKTGWCSFCRNSCACLWSMRRKTTTTTTTTNKSSRFIQYDSRWASNEEFKRILITNRMLMDHFPNTVEDALSYFNTIDRIV